MTLPRPLCALALAVFVAGGIASPPSARSEDLVDFLWGGGAEYGGGRSVVGFDPQYKPNQIIVSFSDRRLYLITKPGEAITYPVAIPTGEARWQGVTFVSTKRVNPPWTPTPEMMRQNPRLPRWVPGGHPMNPLGIRAMYLGSSAYRIHGTDAPWTIGQAVSHGCIRMMNEDVLDLYPRVPVGMRVTVTWQHFSTRSVATNDVSYSSYGSSASNSSNSARAASYGNDSQDGDGRDRQSSGGYGPYGSNNNAPSPSYAADASRAASSRPENGSIGGLFFWNDDAAPRPAPPPAAATASSTAQPSTASSSNAAPPAKKKTSTASQTKKKPDSESNPASAVAHSGASIPDPVKPREIGPSDPAASKSSAIEAPELTPAATNATASASEELSVQKASAQVQ